jgi:predicted aspartyl protease
VSVPFNPRYRLIIVKAIIFGPADRVSASLALDTGASTTTLSLPLLRLAGYVPEAAPEQIRIVTGSGAQFVPRLSLDKIEALGQTQTNLPVLCHTLPPSVTVDGLLGLDFLRDRRLTIDFRAGRITLR